MKTVSTLETEFHQALTQLVGLPLAAIRRAADMLVLHFGTMRVASKADIPSLKNKTPGSIGDIAIHIQCPWRIESKKEILTGRSDLWKPLQRHEFIEASRRILNAMEIYKTRKSNNSWTTKIQM